MIGLLYEFCVKCDKQKVTPSEKEIDLFLRMVGKEDLREDFIKFCFYCWESRYLYLKNNM
jgi:hypothetical protein